MKITVDFELTGGFPQLWSEFKLPQYTESQIIKSIIESWVIDKKLQQEYDGYVKDLDFFVWKIQGQHMIFSNEYKEELNKFIQDRRTSPQYCQKLQKKLLKQKTVVTERSTKEANGSP